MNKLIVGVIVIVIVAIGGYFLFSQNAQSPTTNTNTENSQTPDTDSTSSPVATTHEVMYTNSGYSPLEITVKVGESVTFKNMSSFGMWTASAMHPSHAVYGGSSLQQHCPDTANTSFDQCESVQSDQTWTFTFTKTGTWAYHNHTNASHFGKVIVQ